MKTNWRKHKLQSRPNLTVWPLSITLLVISSCSMRNCAARESWRRKGKYDAMHAIVSRIHDMIYQPAGANFLCCVVLCCVVLCCVVLCCALIGGVGSLFLVVRCLNDKYTSPINPFLHLCVYVCVHLSAFVHMLCVNPGVGKETSGAVTGTSSSLWWHWRRY